MKMEHTSNIRRYWYDENVFSYGSINPCDFNQTKPLCNIDHKGPVYLRFGRPKVPNFTPENQKFEIGKQFIY